MNTRQQQFEDSVILESQLHSFYNGEFIEIPIDNLPKTYKTLDELQSYTDDIYNLEMRSVLHSIIKIRLERLSHKQKDIAFLRYIKKMTYKEIANKLGYNSKNSVKYHIDKIKLVLDLDSTII